MSPSMETLGTLAAIVTILVSIIGALGLAIMRSWLDNLATKTDVAKLEVKLQGSITQCKDDLDQRIDQAEQRLASLEGGAGRA